MSTQDFTKLFYHGYEGEDIEDFLFDFEMYAESKQWDNDRKKKVVGLHVSEGARQWIRELMKATTTWKDLKNLIVKAAKTKYQVEEKVTKLMRMKQEENESITRYANRFESYANAIKEDVRTREKRKWFIKGLKREYRVKVEMNYPTDFNEAKVLALKIEMYEKDDDYDNQKAMKTLLEGSQMNTKLDIDDLTSKIEAMKICRMEEAPKNEIQEIQDTVKKLSKVIKDFTTKNTSQYRNERNIEPRHCYECRREGHMARDCSNKLQRERPTHQNNNRMNTDVRPNSN
ncbi:2789_t:CDS:1 [Scutellospora calospora]|uniref:2789_t:CDS:1 n=1 Tax=Scutellospora calospora TaxID=85575 RepID=A0ACA9MNN8_9GLOM|nr:2789_t:CDS:1 [Scutellospora calospora]